MNLFFYGLFMDGAVLTRKGVSPTHSVIGYVDGLALRIGERATLVHSNGARAHGVMMTISSGEVHALYAEPSVSDYVPEPVTVHVSDGRTVEAICYNLPITKVTGTNKDYASALMQLATRLGFPETYLDEIRQMQ